MKRKTYIIFFFCLISQMARSQHSTIVLSGLKVTPVVGATPESNSFLIELSVSDPSSLVRLEISQEDSGNIGNIPRSIYSVRQNGDHIELVFNKYIIPFEGHGVRFFEKAHDQLKSSFHKIVIEGYDKNNRITNSVVYTQ